MKRKHLSLVFVLLATWIALSMSQESCSNSNCNNVGFCEMVNGEPQCTCIPGFTGDQCEVDIDACISGLCRNNGTCTDLPNGFQCTCPPGFTERQCQMNIDECANDPCVNGICADGIDSYTCECQVGFTGINCEENIDDCLVNLCENGGTCVDGVDEYTCSCVSGFAGFYCQHESNCSPDDNLCQNNGLCEMNEGVMSCACPDGYTGELCETEENECDNSTCQNGATCIDKIGTFNCLCPDGYTDEVCATDIDECAVDPCQNDGECEDYVGGFDCFCKQGFTGLLCHIDIDDCIDFTCQNGGMCVDGINSASCMCPSDYTGTFCETILNPCDGVPCGNNATCIPDDGADYTCICTQDFTGENCDVELTACFPNPCQNNATCETDGINTYICQCQEGFTGENCELPIDYCDNDPCLNSATCISSVGDYKCVCPDDYTGINCSVQIDHCELDTCQNGATCIDLVGTFECLCSPGYEGSLCDIEIDECLSEPCFNNGTCIDEIAKYSCQCVAGFTGQTCETNINECIDVQCENSGKCKDLVNGFECMCLNGYTGTLCQIDIDECASRPCLNNGTCNDDIANFTCTCPSGFDGFTCAVDIDLCDPQPCMNNAECVQNLQDGYFNCSCPVGFQGMFCELDINECDDNLCLNGGSCINNHGSFQCDCRDGFEGFLCETSFFLDCPDDFCLNNGTCITAGSGMGSGFFICECPFDFTGPQCELNLNPCSSDPCQNNATCENSLLDSVYTCICGPDYTGLFCETLDNDCADDPCLNGGTCIDNLLNFTCECLPGFTGSRCDIELDPCSYSPCQNDATCINVDGFTCICTPGFTGALCDNVTNECADNPCQNEATCIDEHLTYSCICPPDFTGDQCAVNLNPCASDPCQNNASCINDPEGEIFSCNCTEGFTGFFCSINIDECAFDPCMNNGTCIDEIAGYTCQCIDGYFGEDCENERDDCEDVFCLNGGFCVDIGATFFCQCEPGFGGTFCESGLNECAPEPCENGGVCQDLIAAYVCECPAGYNGTNCEENINDCIGIYCENNGTCIDRVDEYFCDCVIGWTGPLCEVMIDDCKGILCQNNGTCVDSLDDFLCDCVEGFTGQYCQINVDECVEIVCDNGYCQDLINGYQCLCDLGYTGTFCDIMINDCENVQCLNDGICEDLLNNFTCNCISGYTGRYCEIDINECEGVVCENGGSCLDMIGMFQCECSDGFEGQFCEVNIDECAGNPCQYGASCIDLVNDFECICSPLYTGQKCDTAINLCLDEPCLNNGICEPGVTNGLPSYLCNCIAPYRGDQCEINDQCLLYPCQNNGTCIANITLGTYTCQCEPNYYDMDCQFFDFCYSSPCENGATCSNLELAEGSGSGNSDILLQAEPYTCTCTAEYTGITCDELITPCTNSPCENEGTCSIKNDTFECSCSIGYTGITCSEETSVNNTRPTFRGDSYIAVNVSFDDIISITLSINTKDPNGLIVYGTGINSYFSLGLENGIITAHLSQGDDYTTLQALVNSIVDGSWHSVSIVADESSFKLIVDANIYSMDSTLNLNLWSPIFFGGVSNFSVLPNAVQQNSGFIGTLNSAVVVNDVVIDIVSGALLGANIGEAEIGLCDSDTCSQGGICQLQDDSYYCLCPLGFAGQNCNEDLDIRVPHFTGKSHLIISNAPDSNTSLQIDFTILTAISNGLLFLLYDPSSDNSDYYSLSLINELIVIQYEMTVVHTFNHTINDNEWHIVSIEHYGSFGFLSIDDVEYSYITNNTEDLVSKFTLFLGGIPAIPSIPSTLIQRNGLQGCIRDFQVNNDPIDLISDEHYGLGIRQCPEPECSFVMCGNGGTCVDTEDSLGFVCECPHGYDGLYCQIGVPLCSPNPCLYGGLCEEYSNRTFMCLCPLGIGGRLCEEEFNITVPSFSSNSYLIYPTLPNPINSLSISIAFIPTETNGLLIFNSLADNDFSDYISLALIDSYVVYQYNLGSGAAVLQSNDQVSIDELHTVTIDRTGRYGSLIVDNQPVVNGQSKGVFTGLNIDSNMWLGGYNQFINISAFTGVDVGFSGCISFLSIHEDLVDLVMYAQQGFGVGECNVSLCTGNSCLNGGTCVEIESSFTCECPPAYTGPMCGSDVDPCSTDPCFNGGTCVELADGFNFICHCPLGYKSDLCDEDVAVITPSFSGQSFIRYSSPTDIISTTEIQLIFNPLSHTGILLYLGDVTKSRDFLSLSLVNGHVEFRYDLGSSPAVIISNVSVSLESWHTLEAVRNGKSGSLTIDGVDTSGTSTGSSSLLNPIGDLFLGGVEDYSSVSMFAGPLVGLTGCIASVQIDSSLELISDALSGRNIDECTVDNCAFDPCYNNGSCINTGASYTCICALGYAGTNCKSVIDLEVPLFSGLYSYISYPSLTQSHAVTMIQLQIYPNTSTGLILFNKQFSGSDYIAVLLREGRVELQFDLGSGAVIIRSNSVISLNEWHTIEASRTGPLGKLIVDNSIPVSGTSPGLSTMLQLGDNLHLGGVPDYSLLPEELYINTGFSGCIQELLISQSPINLITDAIAGFDIVDCSDVLSCLNEPCLNGATCIDGINSTFSCQCAEGYTGNICDTFISECSNENLCQNGGQCIVEYVDGSLEEVCKCSLPFSGENCTERVSFDNAQFNGTGFLEFPVDVIQINFINIHTVIKLSITPSSSDGLLFYMGSTDPNTGKYLMIGLREGKAEFRFDLGLGVGVVQSNQPLTIGENHMITVRRTDNRGQIIVSGQEPATGSSPTGAFELNFDDENVILYIGGSSNVQLTSLQEFSSGFSGCVDEAIMIGYPQNTEPLSFDLSSSGLLVQTCPS